MDGRLIVAKYARSTDPIMSKEIALTELLSTGVHIERRSVVSDAQTHVDTKINTVTGPHIDINSLKIDIRMVERAKSRDASLTQDLFNSTIQTQPTIQQNCRKRKSFGFTREQNTTSTNGKSYDSMLLSGVMKIDANNMHPKLRSSYGSDVSTVKTYVEKQKHTLNNTCDKLVNSFNNSVIRQRTMEFGSKILNLFCCCRICFKKANNSQDVNTECEEENESHKIQNHSQFVRLHADRNGEKYKAKDKQDTEQTIEEIKLISSNGSMTKAIKYMINDNFFDRSYFCQFINVTLSPEKSYLITEYSGVDMYELTVHRRHFFEPIAKILIKKLICALQILHGLGIAHGDVSLENVCANIPTYKHILTCTDREIHKQNHSASVDNTKDVFRDIKTYLSDQVLDIEDPDTVEIKLIDYGNTIAHPASPYHQMIAPYEKNTRVVQYSCMDQLHDSSLDSSSYSTGKQCVTSGRYDDSKFMTRLKPYTSRYDVYGKEQYISPERFIAHLDPDASYCSFRDDIYSIGVIICTMLTGVFPYVPDPRPGLTAEMYAKHWKKRYDTYISQTTPLSPHVLDLIDRIFISEDKRISLEAMIHHPWFDT